MQNNDVFKEEKSGSSLSHTHTGRTSRSRYLAALLLGLCLCSLLACSASLNCSSGSLSSACTALPNPTTAAHQPAKTPTAPPPPPGNDGKQGKNLSKPATSIPTLSDEQIVTNVVVHFKDLVLHGSVSSYYKAYNLMDVTLRSKESFDKFVKDPNFTLNKGCLSVGQVKVTQKDSQTWDGSILIQQVSCVDATVLVTFSWHFTVSMANGFPEIIHIGLYPTGLGN
jgi:hypothetical protein